MGGGATTHEVNITNVGLRADPPAAGGKRGLRAKPPAAGGRRWFGAELPITEGMGALPPEAGAFCCFLKKEAHFQALIL